jgi:hypothetical protein
MGTGLNEELSHTLTDLDRPNATAVGCSPFAPKSMTSVSAAYTACACVCVFRL